MEEDLQAGGLELARRRRASREGRKDSRRDRLSPSRDAIDRREIVAEVIDQDGDARRCRG